MVFGFGAVAVIGTALLMLPVAAESRTSTGVVTALFTAVSAVCVTGLVVVDTEGHWSTFGELIILGLIQIGGLGIMTLASLLGLLVAQRMGLRRPVGNQDIAAGREQTGGRRRDPYESAGRGSRRSCAHTTPETLVDEGDQLIVSGRIEDVERFADMT
ncbi:potassium transporter TrkG [Nocardia gipuzkoensis]